MAVYSSFIKKSVFYSFLQILPALAGILVLRIYSSLLSKEQYAVLAILTTVSTLSFIINSLCLDQVITRYYFDHLGNRKSLNDFFLTVIFTIFILVFVLLAGVMFVPASINNYLFKGMLMNYKLQFIAAILVGFSLSLHKSMLSFYRNEQAHSKVFVLTFFASALQVFLVWIGIKYFGNKVLGAQIGKFLGVLLPAFLFIITYFYNKKAQIKFRIIKDIAPFFLPLVLYSIMYWGVSQFDQIIFQMRLKNLDLLALYVMAFNIALFSDLVINGLSSFMVPEMNLVMQTGIEKSRLANYVHLFILIGCFALLFISLAGEILVKYYLDPKYSMIGWLINGLMVGYIFRMLYSIFSFPVYYYKRTMILALSLLFSLLLSLSFNWFLIPVIGLFALVISNVLSRITQAWLTAYPSGKIYRLPYNRWKVYGLSGIFAFFFIILMLVEYFGMVNYFLTFAVIFCIAIVASLILFRKQMPMLLKTFRDRFYRISQGKI